jgi:hypothetical protein
MEDLGLAHMWMDLRRVRDRYTLLPARPSFAKTYPAQARQLSASC